MTRRRSRSKRLHSSQSSSQPSLGSNTTSDLAPSLSPINEHVTGPTSSSNRDNTSSSTGDVPELTRTTSSRPGSSPGDNQSHTMNVTSLQPRNGSPIQMEHSYALTFSSTAEEIPFTNNTYPTATGYREAPPTTTTTSSSQPISIPVSVIQTTPPIVHTTASLPHPQPQISGRGHHISSVRPMPQSILDNISRERPALPPYMLSSVEPTVTYTRNGINVYTPSVPVPTGHAQTSEWSVIARGDETLPHFNSSSPVHPRGMFEVPIPLRFGHYPMGTGIRTTLNDPTAEQNERERQRLENSTSFIASRSHERSSTAGLRRGRRSNRTNETRVEVEVTEPSNDTSSSRHHGSRSRSPNSSTLSGHGRRTRRRARPNNQLFNTAPLTSMSVHVNHSGSTDVASVPLPPHHLPPVPPQMQGFQIVPQASSDVVAHTSSTTLPQTAVLPSVQLPQRFGVPLNSTVFQMTPQLSRNSSEPIYQLSPPQPELLRSHSGSPFHSPGSHSAIVLGNDSMSHSGGAVQFLPVTIDDEPQPASNQTQEVPMVDTREQAVPQSLRATQRDQRLPRRRQSHVEVIIVDSDSEVSMRGREREAGRENNREREERERSTERERPIAFVHVHVCVYMYIPNYGQPHFSYTCTCNSASINFHTCFSPATPPPPPPPPHTHTPSLPALHSQDDDVIVSHVTRVPSSTHLPGRQPVSTDEVFARRLQDQFDQEATRASVVHAGPSIPLPRPSQGLNVDRYSVYMYIVICYNNSAQRAYHCVSVCVSD